MQRETIEEQVQKLLAGMDEQNEQEQETGTIENEAADGKQDIYVLIVREREEEEDQALVVDSTPVLPQKISFLPVYSICGLYLFCILSCIAFQVYGILNPPIATVTIIPKSQTVTMTGTLQLGRVLHPLTISQSQTVSTTGKGHQDAKAASGFITFYNGQFQSVTIAAGTILTGASGTQVVTDQDATIQTANPPIFGQVTVSAHVINPGIRGNIPAYDIHQACCAASVLAKNTQPFTGGQDERDFQTVTKQDISSVVTPLKTAVAQSVNGAFQGQLKPDEALTTPQCTPSVFSNHKIGDEAARVQVTVSETCKVIAYSQQSLQTAASQVMHATLVHLRTPYQLIGPIQTTVRSVSMQNGKPILTATIHGVWVYQVNEGHIKTLVVGKHKLTAIQLLLRLPGVQRVSIDGIADNSLLPDDLSFIHVLIFVAVS